MTAIDEHISPRLAFKQGDDADPLEAPPEPAVMEGGVMLSRSYGSVDPFDRTVKALREHFHLLTNRLHTVDR
jgi:hypothetical protein